MFSTVKLRGGGLEEKRREARGQSLRNNCTATVHFYDAAAKTIFRCLNHSSLVLSGLQEGKKKKLRKELEKIKIWAQTHMQYTMKTEVVGCDL